MSDYNGWTNRATWLVKLWMDNSEVSYKHWQHVTKQLQKDAKDATVGQRRLASQLET